MKSIIRSKGLLVLFWISIVLQMSCTSSGKKFRLEKYGSNECLYLYERADNKSGDEQLDLVSDLFNEECYTEVIELGQHLRKFQRDKFYHIANETAEVFAPEGSFTEYVMESHERSYLTILIALSYLHRGQENSAQVELRKSYEESKAELYNFGDDPVISFLLAALWDRWDPQIARPFWKVLSETTGLDKDLQMFSSRRVQSIDAAASSRVAWKISGYGQIPDVEWSTQILQISSGPYKMTPRDFFPPLCVGPKSLSFPTKSWLEKLNYRYHSDYHPLLLAKSLVRLPIGLTYGALGISGGVALGVSGCIAGAKVESKELCNASVAVAGKLISSSVDFVGYTLKPDLRRWRKLPSLFLLEREPLDAEPDLCQQKLSSSKPAVRLI